MVEDIGGLGDFHCRRHTTRSRMPLTCSNRAQRRCGPNVNHDPLEHSLPLSTRSISARQDLALRALVFVVTVRTSVERQLFPTIQG